MASECVCHTTSCCCYATDTLASCALTRWIWSPKKTRKTPSYPAHFRIVVPVARICFAQRSIQLSACRLSIIFSLELCLQLCIHKLPKLIALCFLAVRVLNFDLHQSRAVLCPLVFKKLLGQLDWFSHLRFRMVIVLAAAYVDCTAVPADLHAQAQSNICNTSCSVLATEAKSFNSMDNLRAITSDALLTQTFSPELETACNSFSATAARP